MEFDDRIRNQLSQQSDELTITPEGAGAVATRSRRRRQRRSAVVIVGAILTVAGIGTIVSNQNDGSEVNVAAPDSEEAADEAGDAASSAATTTPPGADLADGDVLAGGSLVVTDTASDNSPGGFNVWNNTFDNGIYYVLSTAPGKTYEDYQQEGNYEARPDTLYSWDGDSWNVNNFGDRYISELLSDSGVLYTVSTGSPAGPDLAVGSSQDQGGSWTWTSLGAPDPSPDGVYSHTVSGAGDGKVLVALSRPDQPDWEEAIRLANEAGLDISFENSDILNVDFHGIEYFEGGYQSLPGGPCTTASNEFYQDYEESFVEPPFYPEDEFGELSEAEQAEFDAWLAEEEKRYEKLEAERIEMLRGIEGCEEYVQCTIDSNALSKDINEKVEAIFSSADGEPTDEQFAAADKLWLEFEDFYETSGCSEIFSEGFDYEEGEDFEPEYRSWEELGVTTPDSWRGSTSVYLMENGAARELPIANSPGGYLNRAEVLADGYQLTFDTTDYSFEYDEAAGPANTLLTTNGVDGWVATESTAPIRSLEAPPRVGEYSFDVRWDGSTPYGGGSLQRTDAAGQTVRLSVHQLGGNLDTTGYEMFSAAGGDYGVVAWAMRFDDGQSNDYLVDSILFYSDDGISWGATTVPGLSINDVLVGESEALVFTSDPALANSGESQPILRAQLG